MIERLETQKIDPQRDQNLVGLFPGSRSREVRKIFPVMIEAARRLLELNPPLRFQVAAVSEQLADEMRKMVTPHLNPLPSGRGEAKVEAEPNESSHQMPLPLSRGEERIRSAKGPLLDAIEIAV